MGAPGHVSFLTLPFLSWLGTFLESNPEQHIYLDCSLPLCLLDTLLFSIQTEGEALPKP